MSKERLRLRGVEEALPQALPGAVLVGSGSFEGSFRRSEAWSAESEEDPTPFNDFGPKEALNPTPDASDPSKVQKGQRRPRGPTPPKPSA